MIYNFDTGLPATISDQEIKKNIIGASDSDTTMNAAGLSPNSLLAILIFVVVVWGLISLFKSR